MPYGKAYGGANKKKGSSGKGGPLISKPKRTGNKMGNTKSAKSHYGSRKGGRKPK